MAARSGPTVTVHTPSGPFVMACGPVAKSPDTVTVETSGARRRKVTLRSVLTWYPGSAGAARPPPFAAPLGAPFALPEAGGACAQRGKLIAIETARTSIFRMRT